MYHAHFGLERSLFGEGIAAETAVFRTAKHDQLISQFKLALASPSSSLVLQGPAGVGKTTLTSTALRLTNTRLALAWVGGMATNSAELLELILVELGIDTLRTTRIERLQLWRQFQGEMRATDSRLFIVVERTEDLSHEVLHALDQLTAPDASGNAGANLILLGHPGIERHLAPTLLDSLRQRVRLHAELAPFTEAELQDYLRHQVACAGGHFDRIFSPGTVAALHRYTQGVARLVNTLCASALDVAASRQQAQLTAELIAQTAVAQLKLVDPAQPVHSDAAAPLSTPAAVVAAAPASAPSPAPAPAKAAPGPTLPAQSSPSAATAQPPASAVPPSPAIAAPRRTTPVAPSVPPAAAEPKPAIAAQVPPPSPEPKPVEMEYDGSATDVADVALADFPVLTDAVELPLPLAKRTPPAPPAATSPGPQSAPAVQPAPKVAPRIETAYAAPRPAPKAATGTVAPPAAVSPPAAIPAATKPAAPPPAPAVESEDDDLLRQTQSLRAIATAKSIDELSEFDAETLFGEAGLDLVSAALASAEWPDDDDLENLAASAPAPTAPAQRASQEAKRPAPPPPGDDPFDFFGLGEDAPLELIDDSQPLSNGKAAAR